MRWLNVIPFILMYTHSFSQQVYYKGAVVRGDTTQKKIALVFTGDEFADGGNFIARALKKEKARASFFFTGRFYRNTAFKKTIQTLKKKWALSRRSQQRTFALLRLDQKRQPAGHEGAVYG
ncbi:MAG TPA: hypothetical protein VFS22_11050 [Flavisolibacter sp.]|nr:hypothetical protein [Flavisolibacter sp.]